LIPIFYRQALNLSEFPGVDLNGCEPDDFCFPALNDFCDKAVCHEQNQFGLHATKKLPLLDEGLQQLLDSFQIIVVSPPDGM
jgi:hypothetical protein